MLFMTSKYAPQANDEASKMEAAFRTGVLANANRGGENVATGALMGALLGGAVGFSNLPKDLVEGLQKTHRPQLDEEIEVFLQSAGYNDAKL